ncbi:hypothetical protein BSL82_09930 [Tardibacter chloracetimidivorans]|uniref:Bifunctional diguanylate cyclase/phosphodiesterase n=1 Tax=Tardibacter chloracetimidivorans TaxID=1921510 RepID=A0A1L3ZVB3_9SPHN|nr:EAL domain-containing protein [Tardibacter chloracetimidivorans]API59594.1 hypothetical protein BSL82_09930 [Tardibacter chloracetimidivorans]
MTPVAGARRTATIIAVLTIVISLILLIVVASAGLSMNRAAQIMEERTIEREIDRLVTRTLNEQKSVALWDEAVQRIRSGDQEWLDNEVGAYLTGSYGHDRVFLLDGNERPVYAYPRENGGLRARGDEEIHPLADRLLRQIRTGKVDPGLKQRGGDFTSVHDVPEEIEGARALRWSAHLLRDKKHPVIVSAMTVVPTSAGRAGPGRPPVIISIIRLDAERLAALGKAGEIAGLHRGIPNEETEASIPLVADDGTVLGMLAWTPSHPGKSLLYMILPLLALGTAWGAYASVALLQRMLSMSRGMEQSEREAVRLASIDTLSGLPNRRMFIECLTQALARWEEGREDKPLVAYLDLDRFKEVNDTLGHDAGDALVRSAGERLSGAVPEGALLARLGGDEFGVIVPAADPLAGWKLGRALCNAFTTPVPAGVQDVSISASVGIAIPSSPYTSAAGLMRDADIALYRAKEAGRSRAVIFRPEMAEAMERRRDTELNLKRAISGGQLKMVYQPVLTIDGAPKFNSVEALLRWEHPEHGPISPEEFIPIAETSGQMTALGDWVIAQVLKDISRWPGLQVAINLSPVQLKADGFVRRVIRMVAAAHVRPSQIIFEVTENVMMDATGYAGQALKDLREHGFRIALDDFGTGYSSLSYLRRFQFDRLKIDRSFIEGVEENSDAVAVIEAVVTLGRRLGLEIVAEGIENEAQAKLMKEVGCTHLQGWFVARPLESSGVGQMLDTSPRVEPIVRMLRGSAA